MVDSSLSEFIRFLVCFSCYGFCSFVVCRSSSSSVQVWLLGLIVLLALVLVSARVEINRVYIYGHPVADDDGGVTGGTLLVGAENWRFQRPQKHKSIQNR